MLFGLNAYLVEQDFYKQRSRIHGSLWPLSENRSYSFKRLGPKHWCNILVEFDLLVHRVGQEPWTYRDLEEAVINRCRDHEVCSTIVLLGIFDS